jgi:hypothetical protein
MDIDSPILLIAFNRPEYTRKSLEKISHVKPKKLFVAIDGPRIGNPLDLNLCKEVYDVVKDINWVCAVQYLIRDQNVGCKGNVYGAISWVLENEDYVIIIEDDVLAEPAFFYYAQELLVRYISNENIAMISANQYTPIQDQADYIFSNYGHIWGWATWKRVWDKFDLDVPYLEDSLVEGLTNISFLNDRERSYHLKYFTRIFKEMSNGYSDSWGHRFAIFRMNFNLLSIVPSFNLASNIGFVSSREDHKPELIYFESYSNHTIKSHPKIIERNVDYDNLHFNSYISKRKSLLSRIIIKLFK